MEKDDKKKRYAEYAERVEGYYPIEETVKSLPAGFYKPARNSSDGRKYWERKEVVTSKLYALPCAEYDLILNDISNFWKSKERYDKFKSVYKRNIVLYSIPGNGKTSLIQLLCQKLINEHNGIVVYIEQPREMDYYRWLMGKLREIEPERKVITVLEDFEQLIKDPAWISPLLQILDGNGQFSNVVTIATTNYPDKLGKQFVSRPSRFNLIIEHKKPSEEARRFYITNKLEDGGIDVASVEMREKIEHYVKVSDGYTFDFLKELIQSIYVDGLDEGEAISRLNDIIKHNGVYKISEEERKKIGFNKASEMRNSPFSAMRRIHREYDYDDDDDDEGQSEYD